MDNEFTKRFSEAIANATVALDRLTRAIGKAMTPTFKTVGAVYAPLALIEKDKRGRYVVKGKKRRQLKLIVSQHRRGII